MVAVLVFGSWGSYSKTQSMRSGHAVANMFSLKQIPGHGAPGSKKAEGQSVEDLGLHRANQKLTDYWD